MKQFILIILSLFFVFFSFYPTLYEIYREKDLPKDRSFELVHNYVFDYNFYLSRIREGQEGKWLVTEKYYNQEHKESLFQIIYLYLGKIGGIFSLFPPAVYHISRLLMGLTLLMLIGCIVRSLFSGIWSVVAYLFVVTAGSWPILVKLGSGFRFSTYMGWWSVIDSLQRITFIPHVLLGQIFLVLFVWIYSSSEARSSRLLVSNNTFLWGAVGLIAGIIFPPLLIAVYTIFAVLSVMELLITKLPKSLKLFMESEWVNRRLLPRAVFILCTVPALLYLQVMFKVQPWQALSVFDIQHRSILPYTEYFLALGPMLPLGIAGLILALIKREKNFLPYISWILALGLLFAVFEHVPQQSPTRFTQMLINVPLGILATYFFYRLWQMCDKYKRSLTFVTKVGLGSIIAMTILLGLSVMFSTVGWLIDQVRWKAEATWLYPVGTELVYPLKDFMDGIDYLRLNTKTKDVVLAYEAAGNYIPAYAGNFVYLGHANTPDEDNKLKIAAGFFKGEMSPDEAKALLTREHIKYIYLGPQERELVGMNDLLKVYTFITSVYSNNRVTIYKFSI